AASPRPGYVRRAGKRSEASGEAGRGRRRRSAAGGFLSRSQRRRGRPQRTQARARPRAGRSQAGGPLGREKGAMTALDGIRMPDGCYADGTWELNVHVTDLNRDVTLRVTGEIHIGGVMLKLVEKLGKLP
uniref:Kindlin-2 N-terminal domain-containing protein n=1 Tax=Laticauda laticaudata TaxID=8630 RepID=A0A8C5T288_LATLA